MRPQENGFLEYAFELSTDKSKEGCLKQKDQISRRQPTCTFMYASIADAHFGGENLKEDYSRQDYI